MIDICQVNIRNTAKVHSYIYVICSLFYNSSQCTVLHSMICNIHVHRVCNHVEHWGFLYWVCIIQVIFHYVCVQLWKNFIQLYVQVIMLFSKPV